jgi:hypothetical protein
VTDKASLEGCGRTKARPYQERLGYTDRQGE